MNFYSAKKGEEFEEFVLHNLFPEELYTLIHRTNSHEQNNERFSQNTLLPDFQFECKTTKQRFYIEAKFRSDFNNHNKIEVLTKPQFDRFVKLQEDEKCPVFIIVGYEGYASNPQNLSLFPLNQFEYLNVYRSKLREFEVNNKPINYTILKLEDYSFNEVMSINNNNKKPLLLIIAIVIIALFTGFTVVNSINNKQTQQNNVVDDVAQQLQTKVSNYYEILDNGELEKLNDFINPIVDKWYSKENLTLTKIKNQQQTYQEKYPERKTTVLWDTFQVEQDGNNYLVTYQLDYKIKPKNKPSILTYKLQITTRWSQNLKLKSMVEDKL